MADRWTAAAVAAAVMALTAGGVLLFRRPAAPPADGTVAATGTARVVRTDVTVRTLVGGTLGYQDPATVPAVAPGILTWAPAPGAVIAADHRLYEVDGGPVLLLAGARPAWREFAPGMPDGPDVAQLEADLVRAGFGAGLTVDDHFSAATAGAVRRWQAAHGLPRTGAIPLGEVVFRLGPVRVAAVAAPLGAPLRPGDPVLAVTATTVAVSVSLDPALGARVHTGDPVRVTLPGASTAVAAHVGAVGSLSAAAAAGSGGGPATGSGAGTGAAGDAGGAVTLPVTITLDAPPPDPVAGPVQVAITDAVYRAVLAVPIDALLAAPGGGYRVAVRDGGGRRLVDVRTGAFDETDGLVEVTGVAEGAEVEVPAS